jgi:hypothetical protein
MPAADFFQPGFDIGLFVWGLISRFWRGLGGQRAKDRIRAVEDVLLMPYSRSISASSGQDIAEVINPMKMFEYMASRRAIVSADLPSIREVLNEGNAVFCEAGGGRVAPNDPGGAYRDHIGKWSLSLCWPMNRAGGR